MITSDDFVNLARISCYLYRLYTDSLRSDSVNSDFASSLNDASEAVDFVLDFYLENL